MIFKLIFLFFLFWSAETSAADYDPDELFAEARQQAIDGKYELAEKNLLKITEDFPEYWDVHVYLARILAWQHRFEASDEHLKSVDVEHRDASWWVVYTQNPFWDGRHDIALSRLEEAPDTLITEEPDLILIKARALHLSGQSAEALHFLNASEPYLNSPAKALRIYLNSRLAGNFISGKVHYAHYDADPGTFWQVRGGLDIRGSQLEIRYHHARRFGNSGNMIEVESYPVLSDRLYALVFGGISDNTLHPKWHAGMEPFMSLPGGLEVSAGARYMNRETTDTWIVTSSFSGYIGSWFNTIRASYVFGSNEQIALTGTSTYYFRGLFHRLTFRAGTGHYMPSLENSGLQMATTSWWAGAEFIFPVHELHHLQFIADYAKEGVHTLNPRRLSLHSGYIYRF